MVDPGISRTNINRQPTEVLLNLCKKNALGLVNKRLKLLQLPMEQRV